MNRATKRLMAKQEAQAERDRARQMPLAGGKGGGGGRGKPPTARGGDGEGRFRRFGRFLREVRVELKKVAWPSRAEVATYTMVVLISVTFVTLFVFAMDFGFGQAVLKLFTQD